MDSQQTDKAKGVAKTSFGVVRIKHPLKKRNRYERTVAKADTPSVTITKRKEQYSAPWVIESPGGTATTSAYNDGKKRCLSAKGGSGNPRKKVSKQNCAFTKAYRKSGHRLSENEIRTEVHRRQKEIRGAARAVEMAEEEVALEKLIGLAQKEATRKASTGQAGKAKRAAEEAKRWAATGQADKDKHAGEEAARKAVTWQAGTAKRVSEEAAQKAETGQAGTAMRVSEEAPQLAISLHVRG